MAISYFSILVWIFLFIYYYYFFFFTLQVNREVVNTHFGRGVPKYNAIRENSGQWMVQVQSDG